VAIYPKSRFQGTPPKLYDTQGCITCELPTTRELASAFTSLARVDLEQIKFLLDQRGRNVIVRHARAAQPRSFHSHPFAFFPAKGWEPTKASLARYSNALSEASRVTPGLQAIRKRISRTACESLAGKLGLMPVAGLLYTGIKRFARLVRHHPVCVREGPARRPRSSLASSQTGSNHPPAKSGFR
jgi:hypothetical protein